jgi:hypothetical protein
MPRIGTGLGLGLFQSVGGGGFDPDAQAFFDRVTTAGGTLSETEKTATNTLVVSMKADGVWTSMKAIYPMVGASAAACAQNLKSSSFTGTFSSGWTFASTGVTPNGTSAFMNTGLVPNTNLTNNNVHLSYYSRTQNAESSSELGSSNTGYTNQYTLDLYYLGVSQKVFVASNYPVYSATSTNTDTLGFGIGSRTSTTSAKLYMDGVLLGTNVNNNPNGLSTSSIYLGGHNNAGATVEYSSKQCAFASIGDGLTDTQALNFDTAVQAFQTTLSRQV